MNLDRLHTIFANYIRKFDLINNKQHDENYKWRLAAQFPSLMDPDAPDFVAGMKKTRRISKNLIDSFTWPLGGLIECAETEEAEVRKLFKALFVHDGGSLTIRQKKIDAFNRAANALIEKTGHKSKSKYKNDQRSAMSLLFFHDPNSHYLYKYEQVKNFAQLVDFRDDLGMGEAFKMDVYYRMCDEVVEEIRKSDLLLRTTRRRYYDADGNKIPEMHPDENYHILAFDIIWGAGILTLPDYNFGDGIRWMSPNAESAPSGKLEDSTPPPITGNSSPSNGGA